MPPAARKKKPDPTADQSRLLVDAAIQEGKRLAESRLEMIKLFVAKGQTDIAERRIKELIALHPETEEAKAAADLQKGLRKLRPAKSR